jgi:transketolase
VGLDLNSRRALSIEIVPEDVEESPPLTHEELNSFTEFDQIYRTLCALMFNYVPTSGHPGGSISSGRLVATVLFDSLDYDLAHPNRHDADLISYAAGHKALGLYAMWALRNEIARVGAPELLPARPELQLRLEDLLGFRRNLVTDLPLFRSMRAKALDGHPTPATPFVPLATGASGVGVASSLGLAIGAADYYGADAPRVHIIEGEGGLTPGRVAEAMAGAGTASLGNLVMHLDWNQASIDSDHVCRDGDHPGEYVQWTPSELAQLHDWNVVAVPDGHDFQQVVVAQRRALEIDNGQPTAIIYRTTKGWQYGIEGRASHGAGHALCSADFYAALQPFEREFSLELPRCDIDAPPCRRGTNLEAVENCYWEALTTIRRAVEDRTAMVASLAGRLRTARKRLLGRKRSPRSKAPRVEAVFEHATAVTGCPEHLDLEPGTKTTLRGELGKVINHYNRISGGSMVIAAADLLGSTSVATGGAGFADGYWNARSNTNSRLITIGGICEDAISGVMSGLSFYGRHIGVGSSYGAFIAPLGHISARLHAIGNQARQEVSEGPNRPFFLVLAHAGLKTGEDGPTHADPQALQLLQDNFPIGTVITLTPWDPQEIWPLVTEALIKRPAVIAPVVTRPSETVLDRAATGLAPPELSANGLYPLRAATGNADCTLVLQGSEVAYAFVQDALPMLERDGLDLDVFYVASSELFDLLPPAEQEAVFPETRARAAMGITGFTLPTMYRWITSARGRAATLHPFQGGRYLSSGPGSLVLEEAGLDGPSQYRAIKKYLEGG